MKFIFPKIVSFLKDLTTKLNEEFVIKDLGLYITSLMWKFNGSLVDFFSPRQGTQKHLLKSSLVTLITMIKDKSTSFGDDHVGCFCLLK